MISATPRLGARSSDSPQSAAKTYGNQLRTLAFGQPLPTSAGVVVGV